MEIIDCKNFKHSKIKKFARKLDKKLENCCSLEEQVSVLVDIYQTTSFERDFLKGRQLHIERKLTHNAEWVLNKSTDAFVTYVCAMASSSFYKEAPLVGAGFFFLLILYFCFDVKKTFKVSSKRELKTFEIKQIELAFIQDVLSTDKKDFILDNQLLKSYILKRS